MTTKNLIITNPLRRLEQEDGCLLSPENMGAVLSPAGVGKTALVVQIAIDAMLRNVAVLHISLGDSIDKITLWYRELFHNLAGRHTVSKADEIWESILPWRFILTFKVAAFSAPVLEERLADLAEQGIFKPSIIIIDGLSLDENDTDLISELKTLARERGISLWFTAKVHRDDTRQPDGIPSRLAPTTEHFERILELTPGETGIPVTALKGFLSQPGDTGLRLDPATMLIQEN